MTPHEAKLQCSGSYMPRSRPSAARTARDDPPGPPCRQLQSCSVARRHEIAGGVDGPFDSRHLPEGRSRSPQSKLHAGALSRRPAWLPGTFDVRPPAPVQSTPTADRIIPPTDQSEALIFAASLPVARIHASSQFVGGAARNSSIRGKRFIFGLSILAIYCTKFHIGGLHCQRQVCVPL